MVIEKHEGGYLDALGIIDPEYRNEIAELVEAMFNNWGVNRLTVDEDEGCWRAVAELEYEAIEVTESRPIAAIMKLLPYLMLCKAAQHLCG